METKHIELTELLATKEHEGLILRFEDENKKKYHTYIQAQDIGQLIDIICDLDLYIKDNK